MDTLCRCGRCFFKPLKIQDTLKEGFDAYNCNIHYGENLFCHARIFKNFKGVYFSGRVHEYAVLGDLKFKSQTDINIHHKTQKHVTEDRIIRNTRILKKEVDENPENARALFYLANALREAGNYEEALETYKGYLKLPSWRDERYLAQKYIGQILQNQKQHVKAIEEYFKAILIDERWAESYYYIGENYFLLNKYEACIRWMQMAASTDIPDSPLFKEMQIYKDLPYRYLFACYDILQDFTKAVEYCKKAIEKNPFDNWLKQRLQYFRSKAEPDPSGRLVVECYRQGALGDCLMTTAALRGLKEQNPGCFIRYVTHPDSLSILKGNKFIDELTTMGKSDAQRQVYFCYPDINSTLKNEGYPYRPLNRHLTEIFCDCAGLPKQNQFQMECTLSQEEEAFGKNLLKTYGKYITLQTKAGWSPYKEWYQNRWELVVSALSDMGYTVLHITENTQNTINLALPLIGPIKSIVAAIKYSVLHIGVDSVFNHAAQAVGKESVILFGSTSPVGSGYYGYIWKGLECSPCYREYPVMGNSKGPCPFEKKCMGDITVEEVITAIKTSLEIQKLDFS